jgi:hypothetical protein
VLLCRCARDWINSSNVAGLPPTRDIIEDSKILNLSKSPVLLLVTFASILNVLSISSFIRRNVLVKKLTT